MLAHPNTLASGVARRAQALGFPLEDTDLQPLRDPALAAACAALRPEQALFCGAYIASLDPTFATLASGVRACENADMRTAIRVGLSARGERLRVVGEMVTQEIGRIAFSNATRIPQSLREDGDISKLTPEQAACIKSIKRQPGKYDKEGMELEPPVWNVEFWDKLRALEILHAMMGKPQVQGEGMDQPTLADEDQNVIIEVISPGRELPDATDSGYDDDTPDSDPGT